MAAVTGRCEHCTALCQRVAELEEQLAAFRRCGIVRRGWTEARNQALHDFLTSRNLSTEASTWAKVAQDFLTMHAEFAYDRQAPYDLDALPATWMETHKVSARAIRRSYLTWLRGPDCIAAGNKEENHV